MTDVSGEHFELDLSSCHPEWAQEYPEYVVTPDVDTSVSVPTARVPFLRRGKAYLHSENGTPVTISSFQQSSVLRREVKVYLNEGKYCLVLKFDICEDSVH